LLLDPSMVDSFGVHLRARQSGRDRRRLSSGATRRP